MRSIPFRRALPGIPRGRLHGARGIALAGATLVLAAVPLGATPPVVADTSAPTIAFRVVEPDGSPVLRPVVVVSVFGPTYPHVHVLAGGAGGAVVVPFPADDSTAAGRLAAGEPVNLLIRVFDKEPGSAGINAAYVTVAIGVDAFGTLRDLSGVTGTTIPLAANRTDFHAYDGLPGIAGTGSTPWEPQPDYCTSPDNLNSAYLCDVIDYPPDAQHTLVPIADNHGGGNDMYSGITYSTTNNTKTGVAVQAGSTGFFQGNGSVAYDKTNSTVLGFEPTGPGANLEAMLETTFLPSGRACASTRRRTTAGSARSRPRTARRRPAARPPVRDT